MEQLIENCVFYDRVSDDIVACCFIDSAFICKVIELNKTDCVQYQQLCLFSFVFSGSVQFVRNLGSFTYIIDSKFNAVLLKCGSDIDKSKPIFSFCPHKLSDDFTACVKPTSVAIFFLDNTSEEFYKTFYPFR